MLLSDALAVTIFKAACKLEFYDPAHGELLQASSLLSFLRPQAWWQFPERRWKVLNKRLESLASMAARKGPSNLEAVNVQVILRCRCAAQLCFHLALLTNNAGEASESVGSADPSTRRR